MEERCVVCGAVIPEGRQVCPLCEKRWIPASFERGNTPPDKNKEVV